LPTRNLSRTSRGGKDVDSQKNNVVKIDGIFFWTVLLFAATSIEGMASHGVGPVDPVIYFSRAGYFIGVMESGTWTGDPSVPFKVRNRVRSRHYWYDYSPTLQDPPGHGRWVYFDQVRSNWNGPNSGLLGNWRVVAGHYGEPALRPRVRGIHMKRDNPIGSRIFREARTDVQSCFSPGAPLLGVEGKGGASSLPSQDDDGR